LEKVIDLKKANQALPDGYSSALDGDAAVAGRGLPYRRGQAGRAPIAKPIWSSSSLHSQISFSVEQTTSATCPPDQGTPRSSRTKVASRHYACRFHVGSTKTATRRLNGGRLSFAAMAERNGAPAIAGGVS
jgi:hypothetical protein